MGDVGGRTVPKAKGPLRPAKEKSLGVSDH